MVSSNVCAARMIQYVGIRSVIQLARVLGIETPLEYDYTIALGSNGVKLFEFTRAYGAFANGGYVVQPYGIERVETSRGKVVYKAEKTKSSHQLSLKTAAAMTAMLKTVITNGTGAAANIGKPAAGKTGTTDDNKDAYFMGYTPNIVTGVWVGSDANTVMGGNVQGGTVPALIWKEVMKVATVPYGNQDFNYPHITLEPFKLKPGSIEIEEDEENKEEENTENPEEGINVPKAVNPQDVLKNVRSTINSTNVPNPPSQRINPQPVQQQRTTAPSPIPMALPESLH